MALNTVYSVPVGFRTTFTPEEIRGNESAKLCGIPEKCGKQVFVGIFFDGTKNNKYEESKGNNTNIVHLFDAYPDKVSVNDTYYYFSHYIQGVGTPFSEIGELKASSGGSPFAVNGLARIYWGIIQFLNKIGHAISKEFTLIEDGEGKSIATAKEEEAENALRKKLNDLKAKADEQKVPKITQVNLSAFGFSRGAAQARSFTNRLLKVLGSSTEVAGIPLSFDFLGIFDTVASVGFADMANLEHMLLKANSTDEVLGGHMSWATSQNLSIPSYVKKTVHLVAGHEFRASFPVDLAASAEEFIYPGAHSDIGGGYAGYDLGVPTNRISKITGRHMYFAAFKAGVPFRVPSNSNLAKNSKLPPLGDRVISSLTVDDMTASLFNNYMKYIRPVLGNSAREQMFAHGRHYLAARIVFLSTGATAFPPSQNFLVEKSDKIIKRYMDMIVEAAQKGTTPEKKTSIADIQPLNPIKSALKYVYHRFQTSNIREGLSTIADAWDILYGLKSYTEFAPVLKFAVHATHDSSAGFIKELSPLPNGEYSINEQGIAHTRRVYAGLKGLINDHPKPYKQSKVYKALAQPRINAEQAKAAAQRERIQEYMKKSPSELYDPDNSRAPIPKYDPGAIMGD